MKKILLWSVIFIVIVIAICSGVVYYNKTKSDNLKISEKVTDECTEEWEELNNQTKERILETNWAEEKISPNCQMTIKRYYKECNHTVNEYIDVPVELVNKTKTDLEKLYAGYIVEKYTANEIVLYKECEGLCGEHFILRPSTNSKIIIYRINGDKKEEVYQQTEISIEYLPETDKIKINKGLEIFGLENLNQVLEDFE